MRSKNVPKCISIEWLSEFIDAFIDGDAKEETEEYDCTETTWGVFKAYTFFYYHIYNYGQADLENLVVSVGKFMKS